MKNIKKIALTLVLVMALAVVGCGAKTVESFYTKASNKVQIDKQIESTLDQLNGVLSDLKINFSENDIIYEMYFSKDEYIAAVKPAYDENQLNAIKSEIQTECGIEPTSVTIKFFGTDGTEKDSVSK